MSTDTVGSFLRRNLD